MFLDIKIVRNYLWTRQPGSLTTPATFPISSQFYLIARSYLLSSSLPLSSLSSQSAQTSWKLWATRALNRSRYIRISVTNQNPSRGLSETTWWFIDPLEELAGTLGTLEVETAWVLLGVRCGQYQGLVAVTQETFRCNVAVAWVSLLFHTLQVFRQFVHSTRYIALGCPPGCWTAVVLPVTPVRCLDILTVRRWWWVVLIGQYFIWVELFQYLHFWMFTLLIHHRWYFFELDGWNVGLSFLFFKEGFVWR